MISAVAPSHHASPRTLRGPVGAKAPRTRLVKGSIARGCGSRGLRLAAQSSDSTQLFEEVRRRRILLLLGNTQHLTVSTGTECFLNAPLTCSDPVSCPRHVYLCAQAPLLGMPVEQPKTEHVAIRAAKVIICAALNTPF